MTLWKDVKRDVIKEEPEEKEERKPEMIYVAPVRQEETKSGENEEKVEEIKTEETAEGQKTEKEREEIPEEPKAESGEEIHEEPKAESGEEIHEEPKAESGEEIHEGQKTESDEEDYEAKFGEKETKAVLHAAEVEKTESLILWKKLCSRYPHVDIRPVISNTEASESGRHICEVLRIRPSDIGRLPRNNWILAQNQFVRQAYSRFRQIFLLRMEDKNSDGPDENQWFMGVPGENNEQERALAKIFGFTDYFPCRNGGFWYTKIYMGE